MMQSIVARRAFLAACSSASIVLAGCAGIQRTEPETQTQAQRYAGRLSFVMDAVPGSSQAQQSFSGAFELRGSARSGEMDLLTPLGSIVAQLRWSEQEAILIRGNERVVYPSVADMLQQSSGIPLDLAQLFGWLSTPTNRSEVVTQGPWLVDLSARERGRIIARREQPSPAVLRIVLEQP